MIDDSFHLTPLDVRRTEFPAALRGYDKARVDEFRERVAHELDRLTRLNQDLDAKAKGFHEQLRAFRERDKALNEALISAQQLRAETREQAEREAQLVLREARAQGERLVDAARSEVRRLAGEVEALERARRAYLSQLRAMVARQLAELDAIPEVNASSSVASSPGGSLSGQPSAAAPNRPAAASADPVVTAAAGQAPPTARAGGEPSADAASDAGTGSGAGVVASAAAMPPQPPQSPQHPPPPPLGGPPAGEDDLRGSVPTPAWLNTVPAE
jgi:cell division initiation protein